MNQQTPNTLVEPHTESSAVAEVLTPEALELARVRAERMARIKAASNRAARERRKAALR